MRAAFLACLLLPFLVSPATSQITMDRVAISSGGGTVSNGPLRMDLSIGQSVIGTSQTGAIEGDFGFWWQVPNSLVAVGNDKLPAEFAVSQNAPNPFSGSTTIRYAIPAGQHVPVFVGIFNLQGALIRTLINSRQGPGEYALTWNGSSGSGDRLAAGVYFVRIHAGPFQRMRKLVMLK